MKETYCLKIKDILLALNQRDFKKIKEEEHNIIVHVLSVVVKKLDM